MWFLDGGGDSFDVDWIGMRLNEMLDEEDM